MNQQLFDDSTIIRIFALHELLKHYMALYPDAWLSGQRYFELWPRVINLRHAGVL